MVKKDIMVLVSPYSTDEKAIVDEKNINWTNRISKSKYGHSSLCRA